MKFYECARIDKVTYNPWAIELAMNSRGLSVAELAMHSGIKKVVLQALINGDIEATFDQAEILGAALKYPPKFFQQWFETRIEFRNGTSMGKSIQIDYGRYRILNVHPDMPKSISFVPDYAKIDGLLF